MAFIKRIPYMQGPNDVSGVCQYKTKSSDMYPTSLKRKENLSVNPNKIQINYIHVKNTNMEIYKK